MSAAEDTLGPCAGHELVAAAGEIDLATAPHLRSHIVAAADKGSSLVVLDLGEVSFLDSMGVSAIVAGHRRLRSEDRWLHLAGPRPLVRKVLDLTRVSVVVPTFGSVSEALAGCPRAHLA